MSNQILTDERMISRIQNHMETTEECIENFGIPEYVKELLLQDIELLNEIIKHLQRRQEQTTQLPDDEHFKKWLNKYFDVLPEPRIWVSKASKKAYSTNQLIQFHAKAYGDTL